jgi:UDP-2,3-diacylglucosamine hydrolase
MADWLFIADAHLREWNLEPQTRIVQFLEREKKNLEVLVILGDLFEFWFGFEPFAFVGYKPVLAKLEELVREGVRIRYFEGNHDFVLGSYFEKTLKAEIVSKESIFDLDGKRIYVAHGDLVNRRDRIYRTFRLLLRNALTYWLIRRAGPAMTKRVAGFLSSISLGKRARWNPERIERVFQEFAVERMKEGIDVVILAHNHRPQSCSFQIDGRKTLYFNVGDWINHFSFLRYRPGRGFTVEYFEEKDEGERQKERG